MLLISQDVKWFPVIIIFKPIINNVLAATLSSIECLTTQFLSYASYRWLPLSLGWRRVDTKCDTLEQRHKIGRKKERRLWRSEEDMYFPSDCDVAAAVRLKCISANSCAIRRERGTLLMGYHDETRERGVTKGGMKRGERGVSENASEWGEKVKKTVETGNRDGAIFQAIYCNHHSLINQAFHHRTTQSLLLPLPVSLFISTQPPTLIHNCDVRVTSFPFLIHTLIWDSITPPTFVGHPWSSVLLLSAYPINCSQSSSCSSWSNGKSMFMVEQNVASVSATFRTQKLE